MASLPIRILKVMFHTYTSGMMTNSSSESSVKSPPAKTDLPLKGDTVIENDVWIGQNSVILPGVHIGDGAIIGANSVVGSDVPPYTKVVGNPARAIQKRFDDELIELLLRFKWWDRSIDEINRLIPILTCSDLDKVKAEIKKQLG